MSNDIHIDGEGRNGYSLERQETAAPSSRMMELEASAELGGDEQQG